MLEDIYNYFANNKEWLFSGIGGTAIVFFVGFLKFVINRHNNTDSRLNFKQHNKSGSNGTQIGIQNNYGEEKKSE